MPTLVRFQLPQPISDAPPRRGAGVQFHGESTRGLATGAVLKTVGLKSRGGSIPSTHRHSVVVKHIRHVQRLDKPPVGGSNPLATTIQRAVQRLLASLQNLLRWFESITVCQTSSGDLQMAQRAGLQPVVEGSIPSPDTSHCHRAECSGPSKPASRGSTPCGGATQEYVMKKDTFVRQQRPLKWGGARWDGTGL